MKSRNMTLVSFLLLFAIAISCSSTLTEEERLAEYAKHEVEFLKGFNHWETREAAIEKFKKWLVEDTCTFYYGFPFLKESMDISIVNSDDDNIRIYSWDDYSGGTMLCCENIIQYRSDGKLKTFKGAVCDIEASEKEKEYSSGCRTNKIHTFQRNDSTIVYVADSYHRASSMYTSIELNAFCVTNGKLNLVTDMFVSPQGKITSEVTTVYFYSMDEDETFYYDKEFQIFYVPPGAEETDESIKAKDLNYLYRFNGYQFVYFGNDEDFIGNRIIKNRKI